MRTKSQKKWQRYWDSNPGLMANSHLS